MKPLHYSYRAAVSPLLSWGDYDYDSMALRSACLLGSSSHLSVFGNWLSWGPFFLLLPANLGNATCLSGIFGSSGHICYADLGRMKCNGLQIRFGTMVPVKPLGSSRLRKEQFLRLICYHKPWQRLTSAPVMRHGNGYHPLRPPMVNNHPYL